MIDSRFEKLATQVNLLNVYKARKVVYRKLKRTLLASYPSFSKIIGTDIYIKHENHNPTGSFKVRGAVNFMHHVPTEIRKSGIVVATKGNHGLAVAWAARKQGILCNVVVPENNNPQINMAIQAEGAQLIEKGEDFYEAQNYCEELAENAGFFYLRQGNEPEILNGLGTMGLEILEDIPDADVILMPVGGGSGCASLALVVKSINPEVKIIAVQSEQAPAFYLSWKEGKRIITDRAETFADGLAARSVFEVPYLILKDRIDDVVLVSEEEIKKGVELALSLTHNLAEPAGAVTLAAALKIRDKLAGKKVVAVMTGSNINCDQLTAVVESTCIESKDQST